MVIPSVRSMIASLKYMATVLWQDTIDMAYRKDCFDDKNDCLNPCINKVMQHPDFQKELLIYTSMMDANVSYFKHECFKIVFFFIFFQLQFF